ncbi:MAG: hypothetical protein ACE15D_10570 [Candidatus Eisenbacteria bacterium]
MTERLVTVVGLLTVALLVASCSSRPEPGIAGDAGLKIGGFVGKSSTEAASSEQVVLVDASTGQPIATDQTNLFGKYGFDHLPAGKYQVQVGSITRDVVLIDKNVRLDIDLSASDGRMDYVKGSLDAAVKGPTVDAGPSDPQLAQMMAGTYWGYSGSTESKITLCPDGQFFDSSESSYSGSSTDGLGNQTMAWGAAGQSGGAGNWAIQGSREQGTITVGYSGGGRRTIQYRAGAEGGCYYFDDRQLCRTGDANCP